ncbi:hypothetical protein AMAG_07634 [Allomyces macrogynus ATCC 38327]|uniref:PUM-HD domain-containing protein n=1 Tax=Allomyces macrogynus (strain ATCC 38327) TaxID=578462 RepID=A0A0L0SIV6_ALLM3|nr:hypothetical protein AMAG_07634 [Allomyces macrogynus ATCC 38327]|eukprot:KNE62412.1 hypothetical protein AMAG_07634 [Allomyces macrogynus ATCC 38327]
MPPKRATKRDRASSNDGAAVKKQKTAAHSKPAFAKTAGSKQAKPSSVPKFAPAKTPVSAPKKQPIVERKAPVPTSDDEWDDAADGDNGFITDEDDNGMEVDGGDSAAAAPKQRSAHDREAQRESRKQQSELKTLRKAKDPAYPLVIALKKQWERLRRHDLPSEDRETLMTQMMEQAKGRITELIFKHDASRIVQCMVKYGNEEQRQQIAQELKGRFVELSRSMYGRFMTLRLLKYTAAVRPMIIGEFKGHLPKNIRHLIACYVIEGIFSDYCNAKEKHHMLQEFYHPEYRTFKTDVPLAEIVQKHDKKQILHNLLTVIRPCIEKGILGDLTIVQRIALDYVDLASDAERSTLFESLHPELVAILHNREGALLAMRAITYGSAKDRKTIAKGFKDYIMKIASEEYGHWVLLQFIDTVDDTKLSATTILKEIDWSALAENKYLRKTVLFMLVGRSTRQFAPVVLDALVQQGKKDPYRRYTELLDAVSPALLETTTKHVIDWLKDPELAPFAVEVLVRTRFPNDAHAKDAALDDIVDALRSGDRDDTFLRNVKTLVQYHAAWARNQGKAKVKEGYTDEGHAELDATIRETCSAFAARIFKGLLPEQLLDLATGAGTFVALALCEAEATKDAAIKVLAPHVAEIEASGAKGSATLVQVLKA